MVSSLLQHMGLCGTVFLPCPNRFLPFPYRSGTVFYSFQVSCANRDSGRDNTKRVSAPIAWMCYHFLQLCYRLLTISVSCFSSFLLCIGYLSICIGAFFLPFSVNCKLGNVLLVCCSGCSHVFHRCWRKLPSGWAAHGCAEYFMGWIG